MFVVVIFGRRYLKNKKNNSENVSTQKYNFERRLCAQTQDLQIFKKFYISQMNLKEFVHNTQYLVSLPYNIRSVPLIQKYRLVLSAGLSI